MLLIAGVLMVEPNSCRVMGLGLPLMVKLLLAAIVLFLMQARVAHSFSRHLLHHGRASTERCLNIQHSFTTHLRNQKVFTRVGYHASICTTHHLSKGIDELDATNYKTDNFADRDMRKERLHFYLSELGVDAAALEDASFRSQTTMEGFDERFGKSAISHIVHM